MSYQITVHYDNGCNGRSCTWSKGGYDLHQALEIKDYLLSHVASAVSCFVEPERKTIANKKG